MTGMQQAIAANMEKALDVQVFRVSKQIATDAFDDRAGSSSPTA